MFALPQADAGTWSERPAQTVPLPDPNAPNARVTSAGPALPRMVAADAEARRRPVIRPPSRPTSLGNSEASVDTVATNAPEAAEEPQRLPVNVFGVALPGTQYLPTRKDATKVADHVGALGGRGADAVSSTVSRVGDAVSSLGKAAAGTLGLS